MDRTTIMLPSDLKGKAMRRARQMGVSLGELIRTSLATWLDRLEPQETKDPLMADTAVFGGAVPPDLAGNHDRHLYGAGGDLH